MAKVLSKLGRAGIVEIEVESGGDFKVRQLMLCGRAVRGEKIR